MKLQPFIAVDGVPFRTSGAELVVRLGVPAATRRNPVALTELDYGDVVFRFQDATGRLEEVTRRAPVLYLQLDGGVADVPFAGLADFVRAHDAGAFERAGFLVSPRLGLAFVPAEPDWVTALAAHCIGTWRDLGGAPAP